MHQIFSSLCNKFQICSSWSLRDHHAYKDINHICRVYTIQYIGPVSHCTNLTYPFRLYKYKLNKQNRQNEGEGGGEAALRVLADEYKTMRRRKWKVHNFYIFFRQRQHKNKLHTNTFYLWSVLSANSQRGIGEWGMDWDQGTDLRTLTCHAAWQSKQQLHVGCVVLHSPVAWKQLTELSKILPKLFLCFSDISSVFLFMNACTITSNFDYNDVLPRDTQSGLFSKKNE